MVQKSANVEEIGGKDGKSGIGIPWGFEFVGKCGIYHLWPWANLTAHFFAPYLSKFGENQVFRAVVGSQSNSVSRYYLSNPALYFGQIPDRGKTLPDQ